MPPEFEHKLTASLLDRLLDDRPQEDRESGGERLQNLRQMKESVARDLQALLNTTHTSIVSKAFPETLNSIATFGLPDLTLINYHSHNDQEAVRRSLEEAIQRFEPRFSRVYVMLELGKEGGRTLRFKVETILHVPPIIEPVVFDAALELDKQQYEVLEHG